MADSSVITLESAKKEFALAISWLTILSANELKDALLCENPGQKEISIIHEAFLSGNRNLNGAVRAKIHLLCAERK
mgnify:CR=1 FL=1